MVWAGNISSWAKSLSSWVESSQTFIKNTFSWVEPDLDWASWVDPGKNLWIYKSIKNHQVQMIRAFATKKKYFYQISILGRWNLATIKVGSIVGSSSLSWRVEFELIWASSLDLVSKPGLEWVQNWLFLGMTQYYYILLTVTHITSFMGIPRQMCNLW